MKKERVYRHKYNKMKNTARKEKAGKKKALAQVAQLQGMLQGLQLTTANGFLSNQQLFSTPLNRHVQPMIMPSVMIPPIASFLEKISIETASEPEDF